MMGCLRSSRSFELVVLSFCNYICVNIILYGVTPEDPMVSQKSGLLFERRLIVKHLAVRLWEFFFFSVWNWKWK